MVLSLVYVEGNIGVGKSTLLKYIPNRINEHRIVVLPEPVDVWKNSGALQKMYDGTVYSGMFQMMVLVTRGANILDVIASIDAEENTVVIVERSISFGCQAFAEVTMMEKNDADIYKLSAETMQVAIKNAASNIDPSFREYYLYLKVSPEECSKRIQKRGRLEENAITYEYLENLDASHDSIYLQTPDTIQIDGCKEETAVCADVLDVLHKICA